MTFYPAPKVPKGFAVGQDRAEPDVVAHIYTTDECGHAVMPMCSLGWNRGNGMDFSIARGQMGRKGVCKVCVRRMQEGKDPVPPKMRPTKYI